MQRHRTGLSLARSHRQQPGLPRHLREGLLLVRWCQPGLVREDPDLIVSGRIALLILLHVPRLRTGRDAVYLTCMDSRALPGIIGYGQLSHQHDRDDLQLLMEMHPEAFPRLDQVVVEGAQHAQAHIVWYKPLAV